MAAESSTIGRGADPTARFCREDDGTRFTAKTVIVAAHPDDETIGMGARLHRFTRMTLVHVTDGAPMNMQDALRAGFAKRSDYAAARKAELAAALALAGIAPARQRSLGLADQTASHRMPHLIRTLTDMLAEINPDVVVTHPFEGGHPDHDATSFAVHAALEVLRKENLPLPQLIEFSSYHIRNGRMAVFEFLPHAGCPSRTAYLSRAEVRRKEGMVRCFSTQREVLSAFPVQTEVFRRAPRYNFARRPHEGTLYYECFSWGIAQEVWQKNAVRALRRFRITGFL